MAFDLQEQEQIAELKAWWKDWGRHLAVGAAVILVGYAAWQGWQSWQKNRAEHAATVFSRIEASAGDVAKLKAAVAELKKDFAASPYATRAALLAARDAFEKGDLAGAKAELNWVLTHAAEPLARDLAHQRLASVLADEKKYDEALKQVERPEIEEMDAIFAETRGDVLTLKGDVAKARDAYKAALAKQEKGAQSMVEMKLDALGAR